VNSRRPLFTAAVDILPGKLADGGQDAALHQCAHLRYDPPWWGLRQGFRALFRMIRLRVGGLAQNASYADEEGDMKQDRHQDDDDPEGVV